jgi:hypothetical protein
VAILQFFGIGPVLEEVFEGVLTFMIIWPAWRYGSFIDGGRLRILVCHVDLSVKIQG